MTKILLIGNHGQLGADLSPILPQHTISLSQNELNLLHSDNIRNIIREIQPNIIINTAAYTAVDKAESEPEIAEQINAIAPGIIAEECHKLNSFFLHISTDYVFDGTKGYPYNENDLTNPISIYGKTKLLGEQLIKQNCPNHIIIRTAWVYGIYGKSNFVKTMLRLGKERTEIKVVADQIGTPTYTEDLANAIAQILPQLNSEITGTYHYTNSGVASWYDFAINIFTEAEKLGFPLQIKKVIPITTPEYPTPAKRPHYSVLSHQKISKLLGNYPPHWLASLKKMLKQLTIDN